MEREGGDAYERREGQVQQRSERKTRAEDKVSS
jgi:hypothetical protein